MVLADQAGSMTGKFIEGMERLGERPAAQVLQCDAIFPPSRFMPGGYESVQTLWTWRGIRFSATSEEVRRAVRRGFVTGVTEMAARTIWGS